MLKIKLFVNSMYSVSLGIMILATQIGAAVIPISTFEELNKIGRDPAYPLNGDYELVRDIDASASRNMNGGRGFLPIGYVNNEEPYNFIGTFDGKGYAITKLYINRPSYQFVGLFCGMDNGQIKNLRVFADTIVGMNYAGGIIGMMSNNTMTNCSFTGPVVGEQIIGGLVGHIFGDNTVTNSSFVGSVIGDQYIGGIVGIVDGSSITNCSVKGTITGGDAVGGIAGGVDIIKAKSVIDYCSADAVCRGKNIIGGLVGANNGGLIEHSFANGACYGPDIYIGGLVGHTNGGIIRDSYATGDVNGSGEYLGGLVGANNDGQIVRCYATGYVIGNGASRVFMGGLVGANLHDNAGLSIYGSYSTSRVHLDGNNSFTFVGGLVGLNDGGYINTSYATGDVSSSGSTSGSLANYGGFVGSNGISLGKQGMITRCYSTGNVTVTKPTSGYLGGFAGDNYDGMMINECYSTGSVQAERSGTMGFFGGFIGFSDGTVISCYWDVNTSGQATSGAGIGKTTAEMKRSSTYSTWDFTFTWRIRENNSYPYFQASQTVVSVSDNNKLIRHSAGINRPSVTVKGKTLSINSESLVKIIDLKGKTIFKISGKGQFSLSKIPTGRYLVEAREIKSGKRFTSAIFLR